MTRVRWVLAAIGAASALAGGAAGAVLYTNLAVAATPAASVVRISGAPDSSNIGAFSSAPQAAPLAASSPKPSAPAGTHKNCPNMGRSSSTTHS